jgi:hypothetical protein
VKATPPADSDYSEDVVRFAKQVNEAKKGLGPTPVLIVASAAVEKPLYEVGPLFSVEASVAWNDGAALDGLLKHVNETLQTTQKKVPREQCAAWDC